MLHDSALQLWPPKVLDAIADVMIVLSALQPSWRDRLGHRPGLGRLFRQELSCAELCIQILVFKCLGYTAISFFASDQRKGSPVINMRHMITASLRAKATQAFLWLLRFLIRRAQSFKG